MKSYTPEEYASITENFSNFITRNETELKTEAHIAKVSFNNIANAFFTTVTQLNITQFDLDNYWYGVQAEPDEAEKARLLWLDSSIKFLVKKYLKPETTPKDEPAKITHYAIIDQIGKLNGVKQFNDFQVHKKSKIESLQDATQATAYAVVKRHANQEGFANNEIYTLKDVCRDYTGNANIEPSKKLKNKIRYGALPEKVYILCNDEEEPDVKSACAIWNSHDINLEIVNINAFETQHQLYQDTLENLRLEANVWAPAFGWTFSAPPYRNPQNEAIDIFGRRPDYKERIKLDDKHTSRICANPQTYLLSNRKVADDKEILAFHEHLHTIANDYANGYIDPETFAFEGDIDLMNSFLECDFVICEECHRPRNKMADKDQTSKHTATSICPHCDAIYEHELLWYVNYYEDTTDNENDPSDFLDDDTESEFTQYFESEEDNEFEN